MSVLVGARTDFSAGDSIYKVKDLVADAKEAGYRHLLIADNGGINALVPAFNEAGTDLHIGIGARVRVVQDPEYRAPSKRSGEKPKPNWMFMPALYAMNAEGLKDIMRLLSIGNQEGWHRADRQIENVGPQVNARTLMECLKGGNVILTTGDLYSLFSLPDDTADKVMKVIRAAVGSAPNVLCELSCVDTLYHDAINAKAHAYAQRERLPVIVSRPAWYRKGCDEARDVMNAVMNNDKANSPFYKRPVVRNLHVLDQKERVREIAAMFTRLGVDDVMSAARNAIARTIDLATRLDYAWSKLPPCLPDMADDPYEALVELCRKGFKDRLTRPVLGYQPPKDLLPQYMDRLKYELGVLKNMGFENYFLLVEYIVGWSKTNGILVGPGRGSVGGSLVGFLTHITDVDPIRFGLIFERFINPERIDLPDADLDFMSSRRDEVISHLKDRFGDDRVAAVSNYNNLAPASALRSTGKVFGLNERDIECSKYIPKVHGNSAKLEEAVEQVPDIEKFATTHKKPFEIAVGLQGTFRNLAQHAAGIVVANEPITERAVVEYRSGQKVCNWDKRVIEDWGLVKLDILGLSNLDMLKLASTMIEERTGKPVEYTDIDLNDPTVIKGFEEGNTTGVFQFESGGMKKLLKSIAMGGSMTFEDVAAATALYRPGPIDAGLMDAYVQIRQGGRLPEYPHPLTEPALKETQSVIIYQEQVMQIARDLAGFTMAESDKLRKAMGKKLPEEMAKFREKFVDGCQATAGMDDVSAGTLFDQIEKFAGYGFNKSHSVAYTIISVWTMWLKVHHPETFYAAALTILSDEKHAGLAKDAAKNGVMIVPPDINASTDRFEPGYDASRHKPILYAPFQAIKGVSSKGAQEIQKARKALMEKEGRAEFTSQAEFVAHVARRVVNIRVQKAMEDVGVFASVESEQLPALHPDRLKNQKALLGGIMVQDVTADRRIELAQYVKSELIAMQEEVQGCEACEFAGNTHPLPSYGRKPHFMMVFDNPTWSDEQGGKMLNGKGADPVKVALANAGLKASDGYYTALVKAYKGKGAGQLSNAAINGCSGFLDREVDLLKPPVIVCMGGASIRHFCPDVKGGWADLVGRSHYSAALDATIVFALNPGQVAFDSTKQRYLDDVMKQVAELVGLEA